MRRQKSKTTPSESGMQTLVFDGVVDDAHNWRDFGESNHFPKTACEKETQRNEFEKPSHCRKKKTAGGEHHHPFRNAAASAKVQPGSNENDKGQTTPEVESERAKIHGQRTWVRQMFLLSRMKGNGNSYACGKWGQHGADNPQTAMQIDAMPSDQTHLNEEQCEPERKNQSVEMQKQGKAYSA